LGFRSLGLAFIVLDYCIGRSNIYGFWAFLEDLESCLSVFLGEVLYGNFITLNPKNKVITVENN
jgi:hypothetical protein